MPYSQPTRTVDDVIRYVQRVFGDESFTQLEEADLIMFINMACDEVNNRNRILKESATLTALDGIANYTFPAKNILQVEALLVNGVLVKNVSYAQALQEYVGELPSTTSGQPLVWWEWAGRFTLWPTPGAATMQLDYTVRHVPVVQRDDLLPLPDNYYNDIVALVMESAYELDEQPELAGAQREKATTSLNRKAEDERAAQRLTFEVITLVDD